MIEFIAILLWCLFFGVIELCIIGGFVGISSWLKTEPPKNETFAIIDNKVQRIS